MSDVSIAIKLDTCVLLERRRPHTSLPAVGRTDVLQSNRGDHPVARLPCRRMLSLQQPPLLQGNCGRPPSCKATLLPLQHPPYETTASQYPSPWPMCNIHHVTSNRIVKHHRVASHSLKFELEWLQLDDFANIITNVHERE